MSDLSRLLDDIYGAPGDEPGGVQLDTDPGSRWSDDAPAARDAPPATVPTPAPGAGDDALEPTGELAVAGPAAGGWQRCDDDILPTGRASGRLRLSRSRPDGALRPAAPTAPAGAVIEDFAAGPLEGPPAARGALARFRRARA